MSTRLKIRRMTEADVEYGLSLGEMSGWNQVAADWLRIMNYEPEGCFVGMVENSPVGTITTTTYGRELGWIGMMLVHPDHRRKGYATQLMQHAINWLEEQDVGCIKLDATPAGAKVYEKLGFEREWDFHRYVRSGIDSMAFPSTEAKEFQVSEQDAAIFGVNRSDWLKALAADSIVETEGDGFGMLRTGRLATYLGPVVTQHPATAHTIIEGLISQTDRTIFWDAPGPNADAVALTHEFGFQPARDLTRMWRGDKLIRGHVESQFAIASPATG